MKRTIIVTIASIVFVAAALCLGKMHENKHQWDWIENITLETTEVELWTED